LLQCLVREGISVLSRISPVLNWAFPKTRLAQKIRQGAGLANDLRLVIRNEPGVAIASPSPLNTPGRERGRRLRLHIRREDGAIVLGCDLQWLSGRDGGRISLLGARSAVLVRLLADSDPGVEGFFGTISDFCGAGLVGFSSNQADAVLVPDPDFFNTRGYAGMRAVATRATPWRQRSDEIVWRGATSGIGLRTDDDMSAGDARLIQRTRLCLALKGVPGVDAAFAEVAPSDDPRLDGKRLAAAGLLGGRIPPASWAHRRFAIDIDGNTNAWSNLFQRLLLGCCVIKVGSEHDFRQWYYGDLVPWRHYVPVKPDMSDVVEKIEWCRSHPDECEAIAAGGQALAMAMTFERELARGVGTIDRVFSGKGA
jgi:hypothetical protein